MIENCYSVYVHTSPNGKKYVGITSLRPKDRWKGGSAYKTNAHFTSAIKKYGWKNIKHDVLFTGMSMRQACDKEIELIAALETKDKRFGYNKTLGGEGTHGCFATDEMKKKMSDSRKGSKNYFFGQKHSDETKRKNSESHKELCKSEDRIDLMRSVSKIKKEVYQYDLCGNLVKAWESRHQAENYFIEGKKSLAIGKCCQGDCKVAYGYYWSYEKIVDPNRIEKSMLFRNVYQFDKEGNLIKIWDRLDTAVNEYRKDKKSTVIRQCVSGHRNIAYGYMWKYKQNEEVS